MKTLIINPNTFEEQEREFDEFTNEYIYKLKELFKPFTTPLLSVDEDKLFFGVFDKQNKYKITIEKLKNEI